MPGHLSTLKIASSNHGVYVYTEHNAYTEGSFGNLLVVVGKHGVGTSWNIFKNSVKY
jgi:hypothetical protein